MTDIALILLGAFALLWLGYEIRRRARFRFEARIRARDWNLHRDWER